MILNAASLTLLIFNLRAQVAVDKVVVVGCFGNIIKMSFLTLVI